MDLGMQSDGLVVSSLPGLSTYIIFSLLYHCLCTVFSITVENVNINKLTKLANLFFKSNNTLFKYLYLYLYYIYIYIIFIFIYL